MISDPSAWWWTSRRRSRPPASTTSRRRCSSSPQYTQSIDATGRRREAVPAARRIEDVDDVQTVYRQRRRARRGARRAGTGCGRAAVARRREPVLPEVVVVDSRPSAGHGGAGVCDAVRTSVRLREGAAHARAGRRPGADPVRHRRGRRGSRTRRRRWSRWVSSAPADAGCPAVGRHRGGSRTGYRAPSRRGRDRAGVQPAQRADRDRDGAGRRGGDAGRPPGPDPGRQHTPSEVKAAITGSGRADKAQIGRMVTRVLKLAEAPRNPRTPPMRSPWPSATLAGGAGGRPGPPRPGTRTERPGSAGVAHDRPAERHRDRSAGRPPS